MKSKKCPFCQIEINTWNVLCTVCWAERERHIKDMKKNVAVRRGVDWFYCVKCRVCTSLYYDYAKDNPNWLCSDCNEGIE